MRIPKPYDRDLDEKIGKKAEEKIVAFLEKHEYIESVDLFPFGVKDVDLRIRDLSGDIWYADVECRESWKKWQLNFPFDPIHVPYRKRKFIEKRIPFVYFIVREDYQRMAILYGKHIQTSEIVRSKNKYANDHFYSVPIEHLKYWDLEV